MKRKAWLILPICLGILAVLFVAGGLRIVFGATPSASSQLIAQANESKDLGLWDEAIPAYRSLLARTLSPADRDAVRLALAECIEISAPEEAIQLYDQVAAANLGNEIETTARLKRAHVLAILEPPTAMTEFTAIIEKHPDGNAAVAAKAGIAQCYQNMGLKVKAHLAYQQVAQEHADTALGAETMCRWAEFMFGFGIWGAPPPEQAPVIEQVLSNAYASDEVRAEAKWLLACGKKGLKERDAELQLRKEVVAEFPNTDRALRELGTVAGMAMADGGLDICRTFLDAIRSDPRCIGTDVIAVADDIDQLLDLPDCWTDPAGVPPRLLGIRGLFYLQWDPELATEAFLALVDQYPNYAYSHLALEAIAEIAA